MVGTSSSSKSPRSTSPFRSKKGFTSPLTSPAIKNVAVRPASPSSDRSEFSKPKENVTVTVRFRPLRLFYRYRYRYRYCLNLILFFYFGFGVIFFVFWFFFGGGSAREMKKGNEIAWYADGNCTVRNEYNPNLAYAFGQFFSSFFI